MLTRIQTHISWLNRFLHDNKGVKYFLLLLLIIILVGTGLIVLFMTTRPPAPSHSSITTIPKKTVPVAVKYYSPVTGMEVPTQAATTQPVTAIMIENSTDARPQSGLKEAGVVFEAIAEGGITRFAAIYQEAKPQLIGPVRSVRPYFIDWIAPFDASIAHVGGSALALTTVRNGQYRDIDQFFNASTYWRATDRYAPHNVYTSFAKLDALNTSKGYTSSIPSGFARVDPTVADKDKQQGTPATTIVVHISGSLYDSSYSYDPASGTYPRSEGGLPHMDREEGQIAPKAVVVMKIPEKTVMQDGYREDITTVGSGQVFVFERGQVFLGTWNKPSQKTQLTFTGTDGKPILLERGQTWLTSIPTGESVSWQ